MMMKLFATTAAFVLVSTGFSLAAVDTQALVNSYQADGYTSIEVKTSVSQVKVEAVRGTEKVEVVYDKATGAVLKSETQAIGPGDDISAGVSFDRRNDDFVNGSDDSGASHDDSDGRGEDRGSDDNSGGDRGGDDNSGGDRGGDDNGGGDRGGDDNGGDRGGDSSDD